MLLMVFLTSSPFLLLFDKKKQADVNSHGIEYAETLVKEGKENLAADLEISESGGRNV